MKKLLSVLLALMLCLALIPAMAEEHEEVTLTFGSIWSSESEATRAPFLKTLEEFADYIKEQVPDAITAYNFDGGGSTNLILNGKKIHKTPGLREITDIIYFASAKE